jgi:hypothetical protein
MMEPIVIYTHCLASMNLTARSEMAFGRNESSQEYSGAWIKLELLIQVEQCRDMSWNWLFTHGQIYSVLCCDCRSLKANQSSTCISNFKWS